MDIQNIELSNTIEHAIRQITVMAAKRNIELFFHPPDATFPQGGADPYRLRQVLLNLLSNGIKNYCEGGSITITCQLSGDSSVCLSKVDMGIVISEAEWDKVFESCERLLTSGHDIAGSGIGPSLSQNLIEVVGGASGFTSIED